MCLERTMEGWVGVDGTDGGGETVPYVGADHWEGTPSELRPASLDGSGSSSGGAKLAYIWVGRSKHDKVREVRRASTVESLMHDSSNFEGDTVLDRQPVTALTASEPTSYYSMWWYNTVKR